MGRTYSIFEEPFAGDDNDGNSITTSVSTSKIIDLSGAFDWSYSWHTTGSTVTSAVTLELSNAKSISRLTNPKVWSVWTVFGHTAPPLPSGASIEFPPLGVRFARFRRRVSSVTTAWSDVVVHVNILHNG